VILVGHSMGGMVITQVAENRPAEIERLVYVAAFVPTDGQNLFELAMSDPDSQIGPHLVFAAETVGIDAAFFVDLFCADCSADAKTALAAQYRDEPIAPLMTPVTRTAAFDAVPRRYVHTSMDLAVSPAAQAAMVTATPMEREITLATSHVAMMSMPDAVADALLP
jgi:pimeloyl-ACP methyl ester carboxylesterase